MQIGSGKPMFEQFKEKLIQMIENKTYKPGDLLPSERELAHDFNISRVTVRRSLDALASDGIIIKKQGKGNFVAASKIESKLETLLGFVEEFTEQGMKCVITVIKQGYETAPEDIASAMALKNNPEMFLLVRHISVDGKALGVDNIYIPRAIAYQFDLVDFSKVFVYRFLEQQGYKLISAEQSITVELPTSKDCAFLGIEPKDPILVRCRVAYMEDNRPIAYSRTLYRGDRYSYNLTLNRFSSDNLNLNHS